MSDEFSSCDCPPGCGYIPSGSLGNASIPSGALEIGYIGRSEDDWERFVAGLAYPWSWPKYRRPFLQYMADGFRAVYEVRDVIFILLALALVLLAIFAT